MKRALVLIATTTLLSGCAMFPRIAWSPNCPNATCPVTVTFRGCNDIDVQPEDVMVERSHGAKHIEWTLAGPSQWSFVDDGIAFKYDTEGEFDGKEKQARKFKYKFKNSKPNRTHKYKVVVTDGRQVCVKDPSIMNN